MPILNSGPDRNPSIVGLLNDPVVVLRRHGPIVPVLISVPQALAEALVANGKVVPPPVPGLAVIDTEASVTCIDRDAAAALALPVIDVVTMQSASHTVQTNVYPIHFETVGFSFETEIPGAMSASLKAQDLVLLIGRDVLAHGVLIYNGLTGTFTLAT